MGRADPVAGRTEQHEDTRHRGGRGNRGQASQQKSPRLRLPAAEHRFGHLPAAQQHQENGAAVENGTGRSPVEKAAAARTETTRLRRRSANMPAKAQSARPIENFEVDEAPEELRVVETNRKPASGSTWQEPVIA